ncbi:hypothetical protein ACFOOK_06465 [Micromonospora krabiensis]|uniref:DUF998 domain-containing protein n=1 Tax=Micromonospora krabiensis TaxID=307121 RepID=A0A1C3NCU7_9ACTN|nr:hypothetical protein [Micromonospora krabiensis]SBV30358.1 hypothetical protein GA0070620_5955 [Micromonospora krabiensis]
MTTDSVPAGGDPRRLLAEARDLARRVRLAQRVTWLPLLVLSLVTFGAIPVYRFGHQVVSDCRPVADGQVCRVEFQAVGFYWLGAMVAAYVVIAAGYLRVARARGVGARVWPYVLTGVALVVLFSVVPPEWIFRDPSVYGNHPSAASLFLTRLLDPTGLVGLALLMLAWLERHVALLLFTLGYLAVVLVPVNAWGGHWGDTPRLVVSGGLLLLGGGGFALAQRLRRSR